MGNGWSSRMKVGLVYDPLYLEHDLETHPENARRLRAVMSLLEEAGLIGRLESIAARDASTDELGWVHTAEHVARVREWAAQGGAWADADTYICDRSYDAALRAAGGCLAATEAVLGGGVGSAFCLVRPPGHHATPTRAMGFCLFNNIAIAAELARRRHGLERVAIVDFDVHHGNGTQEAFYEEANVLYYSSHLYPFYPGSGHWREVGQGAGRGATVNVPLPGGCGDGEYRRVGAEILTPVLRRFQPELILASAGFDGHFSDPLAGMSLSVAGFGEIVATVKALAEELCEGRLVLTLEGGYDLTALPWGVRTVFEVLLGDEPTPDPLGRGVGREDARLVDELIAAVREAHNLS
jgi:acetoin utilization deacetylase AcuC-like enzyme